MPPSFSRRRLFLVVAGAAATAVGGLAAAVRPTVSAGWLLDAPDAIVDAKPGHYVSDTGPDCGIGPVEEATTTWFVHVGGEAVDPSELYLTRANSPERKPIAHCMRDEEAPFEAGSRLVVDVPDGSTVHLVWSPTGTGPLAALTAVVLATVRLAGEDDA
ncbi:hypothetical protein [Halorubellus salinus]|uniref:hypothetical protein n=1 Tax=Halorubellus salinus TaxID=755309 RepID=UPI001D06EE15|nr:hypothetical protein [Halorubellus salinus]